MRDGNRDAFWLGVADGLVKGSFFGSAFLMAIVAAKVFGLIH